MSDGLRAAAADYLRTRRARGYQFTGHRQLIATFLDELAARGVTTISVTDAMAFAQARPEITRARQAARLQAIRAFAAHARMLDPAAAELIPSGLIAAKVVRRIPYLYSDEQISQLISGTAALSPPLFAASMGTLTGLLAAAGLRSGEAVALDLEDLDQQGLTVTGKYGRKRLVPLHPTTLEALDDYQRVRARLTGAAPAGPLLVAAKGGRLDQTTAQAAFRAVAGACDLPARPGCGSPRLHDFRHTFAVNSLLDAYRQGADVDARIATLATYLGHVNPVHTYWYYSDSRVIPIPAPLRAWWACDLG
jgi:integrase